jgi:hypothetical protein
MARDGEVIRLAIPIDERYLDVAIAAIEVLADRAGVDAHDLAELRGSVRSALTDRLVGGNGTPEVVLCYEVGEGFLGVRVEDDRRTGRATSVTS